jgi:hypothetical protein
MSTPLYAPSLAAGNQGITLAMRLGDENLLQPGDFAAEIGLISRLDALANLQPWAAMANAVDRAARYQELETTFAETIAEATAARKRLEESRQELTGKVRQMQAEREDYEKRYFAALNAGSSQNAQKWHGLFVESQVAWVKERAELGKINGILSRVTRQINPVRAQYAALKNNRDALIAGIRVDAKTARAAGVVGTANP